MINNVKPPLTISFFEAFVLMFEHYKREGNEEICEEIRCVALDVSPKNQARFDVLKKGTEVEDYLISSDPAVVDDVARRYFESHFAYELLCDALPLLDDDLLGRYYKDLSKIFGAKPLPTSLLTLSDINAIVCALEQQRKVILGFDFVHVLYSICFAADLSPTTLLKKILLLEAIQTWSAEITTHYHDSSLTSLARGRVSKLEVVAKAAETKAGVKNGDRMHIPSGNLGILRASMPTPMNDLLRIAKGFSIGRAADKMRYDISVPLVREMLENGIPFVCSVSGCLIRQFRWIETSIKKNTFTYQNDPEQFRLFLLCFMAWGVLYIGGHSFGEYLIINNPLLAGYVSPLLDEKGKAACERALQKTILYNRVLLTKKRVHQELIFNFEARQRESSYEDGIIKLVAAFMLLSTLVKVNQELSAGARLYYWVVVLCAMGSCYFFGNTIISMRTKFFTGCSGSSSNKRSVSPLQLSGEIDKIDGLSPKIG